MHSLHTKLRESCEEAFTQMRNARDIFLNEIALKYEYIVFKCSPV